jgi:hypothetical protein
MPTTDNNMVNAAIKERFYSAIRTLMEKGTLRGRQTYCKLAGIDKRNFYAQEKDTQLLRLQLYWLVPLVQVYNVSAEWLLTGAGAMFKVEPPAKPRKQRVSRYPKPMQEG